MTSDLKKKKEESHNMTNLTKECVNIKKISEQEKSVTNLFEDFG